MKLEKELVRDLLLYFEATLTFDHHIDISLLTKEQLPYDQDDLIYTTQKLIEANFINATTAKCISNKPSIHVTSLTYNGHEFLDQIRDDCVWKKVKKVTSSAFTSVSLSVINCVATAIIKSQLNIK